MAKMRLRTDNSQLKIEHSILDGGRAMLNRLLRDRDDIPSIVPGRIAIVRDARSPVKKLNVSYRSDPPLQPS